MTAPQSDASPSNPPVWKRLADELIKSPFVTAWNLAIIIGGLLAMLYFIQLGYLPDLDPKTSSFFFVGIALLGLVLFALLMIAFGLPAWMLRTEVHRDASAEPRLLALRIALCGFFAEFFYLFVIAIYLVIIGQHRLGYGLAAFAALATVVTGIWMRRLKAQWMQLLLPFLLWLMLTPSVWLLVLGRVSAVEGEVATLSVASIFVSAVVVANALLASMRFNAGKAWLITAAVVVGLPFIYLALPTKQPGIPENVFRKLSLGGMPNTKLVVRQSACDATNVLVAKACTQVSGKEMGCITPTLMANRLGEYLLVFEQGQYRIKVPMQKADVMAWSSSDQKPDCKVPQ